MVIMDESTFSGCIIETRPIGVMRMIDGGDSDDKIIGVSVDDPRFEDVKDIQDLPQAFLNEITHFFQEYKKLEGKTTEILGWENAQKAMESIEYSMKLFKEIE
jgi:inorganic pyrophosphatase